jgi:hypothetical protein
MASQTVGLNYCEITMKKRIKSLSVVQFGIVLGLLYALLACLVVPIGIGVLIFAHGSNKVPGIFMLFAPVIYGGIGCLMAMLMALVYNLIAHFTGGVEFTVADAG